MEYRETQSRGHVAALILLAFWFQPLALWNTGVPVAAILLGLYLSTIVARSLLRMRNCWVPMTVATLAAFAGLIWSLIPVLFADRPISRIYEWFTLFAVIAFGPHMLRGQAGGKAVQLSAELGTLISAVAVVVESTISRNLFGLLPSFEGERMTALHYNANGGALFLLMGTVVLLGYIRFVPMSRPRRTIDAILVLLGAWAITQTGSWGAIGALAVATVMTYLFRCERKPASVPIAVRMGLAAAGALIVGRWLASDAGSAFIGRNDRQLDVSTSRGQVWDWAWSEVLRSPVFGVKEFAPVPWIANAHNFWLEVGLRSGVIGIFLYFLIVTFYLRQFLLVIARQGSRPFGIAAGLMLSACLVIGFSHVAILDNSYFWLIVSGLLAQTASESPALRTSLGPRRRDLASLKSGLEPSPT